MTEAQKRVLSEGHEKMHGCVKPGGWLDQRLHNISNPRRLKWNSYFRACRKIPKGTPCYGITSWKRINQRRGELINADVPDGHEEFEALQRVAGEIGTGNLVADCLIMRRFLRRMAAVGLATGEER